MCAVIGFQTLRQFDPATNRSDGRGERAAAGAPDAPEAMYRGWGVPLGQPWNYDRAQNMFMITQALPGPGKLHLRTIIAQSDVSVAKDELAMMRLQVQVEG